MADVTDIYILIALETGFPGGSNSKEPACNAGDLGSIPEWERSSGERNDYPLQSTIFAWRIPWTEEPGGHNPWACKESQMTEQLTRSIFSSGDSRSEIKACRALLPFKGSRQQSVQWVSPSNGVQESTIWCWLVEASPRPLWSSSMVFSPRVCHIQLESNPDNLVFTWLSAKTLFPNEVVF